MIRYPCTFSGFILIWYWGIHFSSWLRMSNPSENLHGYYSYFMHILSIFCRKGCRVKSWIKWKTFIKKIYWGTGGNACSNCSTVLHRYWILHSRYISEMNRRNRIEMTIFGGSFRIVPSKRINLTIKIHLFAEK